MQSHIQSTIDECLPLLKALGTGRCAVSMGGSYGKGTSDARSDLDFRLFCDGVVPGVYETDAWRRFMEIVDDRRAQGLHIDNCWIRTVEQIESELAPWLDGRVSPKEMAWTIWGYHLLTDIANQVVIDDPSGLIAGWQAKLTPYPVALRWAVVEKHMCSLKYWRDDYHYMNKVERGDEVFLAGISARLVHDMIQVLFALNETYYVGDGNNLRYVERFPIKPRDFVERVKAVLYPVTITDGFRGQYEAVLELIDDTIVLAQENARG